jgi:hypothetical protein
MTQILVPSQLPSNSRLKEENINLQEAIIMLVSEKEKLEEQLKDTKAYHQIEIQKL